MDNKSRMKYFYEVVTSNGLTDEVPNYVSDSCVVRLGEAVYPVGIAGMQQHLIDVRKTYPDLKMTILRQYCDGEFVISEFIMEGTHAGEWLGIQPSGKRLSISGVNIDRIVDGKITEHGGAANTFDAFWEAGVIVPAPVKEE